MSGIFKKAIGLFVEFEEDKASSAPSANPLPKAAPQGPPPVSAALQADDIEKFEKHFEKVFDQANLPGPDYYEFWKMMEALSVHIRDERSRIAATFASLSIQGLTKEKLVSTAQQYKTLISEDRTRFEKVAQEKLEHDIGQKRQELRQLEETVARHAELIKKLTQDISAAQQSMKGLQSVITEEESKLDKNKQGYAVACDAMIRKIDDDINKIQTTL
jgi:DNA repair exonuclease SbcCD ATPase subunit